MRRRILWVCVSWCAVSLALPGAPAVAAPPSPWRFGSPETVAASAGVFDPLVSGGGNSYEIGTEVRFAPRRFHFLPRFLPELAPMAGVIAGSPGNLYAYAGVQAEYRLGPRWLLTPGWAVGLYDRSPRFDLGGPLEFRTSVELAFRLASGSRLGLCLDHLSNAGLFTRNPGSESLVLTYRADLRPRKE